MSILGRIRDLISANVNTALDKAEDPEKMANEYLRQLNDEYYEAKTNVAAAMADETKLQQKLVQHQTEVDQWQSKAEAALRAGNEELAKAALERKGQAQKLAEQYKSQYEAQSDQVDHLQEALADLETRIAETKAKKELIIAKKNRAQTQETLQQTMSGFGNSNVMDKLDNLEGRVDDRLAQADAMTQLEGGSLENRFRELEKDAEVDSELEELKRKMGMS